MKSMLRTIIAVALSALPLTAHGITQSDLVQRTEELYRTLSLGDQRPWKLYIADDVLFFSEKGYPMNKKALLDDVSPFPAGYSGTIVLTHIHSNIMPGVAIMSYDMNETETIYGQELHARYHETDTWLLRNGKWQIAGGQVLRYYEDPAPGALQPAHLDDYVGTYQIAPGQTIVVTRQGDKLFTQRSETLKRTELVVEATDIFFRPGVEGRRLFHRNREGKVDSLVDRRNNEDLIWKRVQ